MLTNYCMKMSALTLLVILMVNSVSLVFAEPTEQDFVEDEKLKYFGGLTGKHEWSAEVNGWWIGIRPPAEQLSYVVGGGLGETVDIEVTVFTKDPNWQKWAGYDDLDLELVILAGKKGEPLKFKKSVHRVGLSANGHGTCWKFIIPIALDSLSSVWKPLPDKVSIKARLAHMGLPEPISGATNLSINPTPIDKATWNQKVDSLKKGQGGDSVTAILGKEDEKIKLEKGESKLIFPNPDAPKELPVRMRKTWIYLDQNGCFLGAHHTQFGC